MNVIEQTLETIKNQLLSDGRRLMTRKEAAETARNKVYANIVDLLPAGCVPEDVADAAQALFEQLEVALDCSPKLRVVTDEDFRSLISHYIMLTFKPSASVETIYQDLLDHSMTTITLDDVKTEVRYLLTDAGGWKDLYEAELTDGRNIIVEEVSADERATDEFISHINQHIVNTPVGGYEAEQSRVAITVGDKTFEFYDHAALMQSLLEGLQHLKTEL